MLYPNDSRGAERAMEDMRTGRHGEDYIDDSDFYVYDDDEDEDEDDEDGRRRFIIDDDDKAAWAVRKIQERVRECDRSIAWYKAQIKKCEERTEQSTAYLKSLLRDYFETVPHRETKTRTVYDMPGGQLMLRKARLEYAYDKEAPERLIGELKDKGIQAVKVKESVDWRALKSSLVCTDGDVYAVSEDGEMIKLENVGLEERPEEFLVKGE